MILSFVKNGGSDVGILQDEVLPSSTVRSGCCRPCPCPGGSGAGSNYLTGGQRQLFDRNSDDRSRRRQGAVPQRRGGEADKGRRGFGGKFDRRARAPRTAVGRSAGTLGSCAARPQQPGCNICRTLVVVRRSAVLCCPGYGRGQTAQVLLAMFAVISLTISAHNAEIIVFLAEKIRHILRKECGDYGGLYPSA